MIKKNYIPTIDISAIYKYGLNHKKSLKILEEIEKACTKVGFFQIIGPVSYTHLTLPTTLTV